MFGQGTPLQSLFLLDANFIEHKVFEDLVIQAKKLLTQWKTEEEKHGYIKLRAKNLPTSKRRLGKKKYELYQDG